MKCVYKLTFRERRDAGLNPYMYIGSKINCRFEDGVIYEFNKLKQYWSSCKQKRFRDALKQELPLVEILFSTNDDINILEFEERIQRDNNVVECPDYFNRVYANTKFAGFGKFGSNSGYAHTEQAKSAMSKSKKGKPLSDTHKTNLSKALAYEYENTEKVLNDRGRLVSKRHSEQAKSRHLDVNNEHPNGFKGKKQPRVQCPYCLADYPVNTIKRHKNKCFNENKDKITLVN